MYVKYTYVYIIIRKKIIIMFIYIILLSVRIIIIFIHKILLYVKYFAWKYVNLEGLSITNLNAIIFLLGNLSHCILIDII